MTAAETRCATRSSWLAISPASALLAGARYLRASAR
ncbi:hypothetical protein HD597_010254 [Nonomuraea thailandensis]|uniref:Uncharacterized protein n=1 Tax=Nonomuraea thailandensis TaxID=1188745 RepID=A0A9X2K877_9ACTN|nr:hypothetical protein [Nonomuraea thailandensis]